MRNVNWSQTLVFALVVLVVFALGAGVLLLLFGGGLGMAGPGWMGPGRMRGGWCPWCGGTGRVGGGLLGPILGLSLTCLLPLALLAVLVVGGVWLVRNAGSGTSRSSGPECPTCGRLVEPGWQACPCCGEDLSDE